MKKLSGWWSLLLVAGLAPAAVAQPCPLGPSSQTYAASTLTPAFTSIVGSPSAILIHGTIVDDAVSAPIALPIAFAFQGTARTSFTVDSNGTVRFSGGASDFTNDAIPAAASPNDWVGAWWDDLHTGTVGSVYRDVTPGGSLVIEWNSVQHFPNNTSGENATFQVVLNPSPANTIEFRYDSATFASGTDLWNASCGIEDLTGTVGTDVTGGGATNATFPASDWLLTPGAIVIPGAPILTTYFVAATTPAFTSVVGSPSAVLVHGPGVDDSVSAAIPLPIAFTYMGVAQTSFSVDSNGTVRFGGGGSDFTNDPIPSTLTPNNWIGAWWDDLHTGTVGSVYYDVTAGGSLVVEWNSVQHFPNNTSGENATFQAVLNPSPANTIEFHYDSATFASGTDLWTATVGIEDPTGATGVDATGLGATNALFPSTDYLFTPCGACGTTSTFATPCAAAIGSSGGAPTAGNLAFAITQSGATPSVPALLLLGISNTAWVIPPAIPLPVPFVAFGFFGPCSLVVSPDIVFPTLTSPAGTSSVPMPIPPGTPSCGTAYFQWVNVIGAAPITLEASNGLTVVTG